jgi:phosphatidylserine/phosphatidylglycerophosphate/cardiolipin synthase-like enzyme
MSCCRIALIWGGLLATAVGTLPQASAQSSAAPVMVPQTHIRVYFTPGDSAEMAILEQLAGAKDSILVQAYSFTNPAIASALGDARSRGVNVIILLDKSQRSQKYSAADYASHSGISTYIDDRHAIAHNKIMIIDGQVVITGSYNFTRAAEKSNAENLVIIESGPIAEKYINNWQKHRRHSQPYQAR